MNKAIYFDMDGTLADFYGVNGWLNCLQNSDPTPYAVAKPLLRLCTLARKLNQLQAKGYHIGIISWLPKNSNFVFDMIVTQVKREWLQKHMPSVKWDSIDIIPYGEQKSKFGNGILFDDEEPNRSDWGADAHTETEIMDILNELN